MDIRKKEKQVKISIEDIPTSHISYADFTSALIDILEFLCSSKNDNCW